MHEYLDPVLKISLIAFMLGSLGSMGLELAVEEAIAAFRNTRFVFLALLLGFLFCPAVAYVIANIFPLEPSYAMGLVLLGMAPSAPFMPLVVRKANGDLAYTAAFMLLSATGTVVFMPVAAPIMITGLQAGAWVIGKPLVLFILVPLVAGCAVKSASPGMASRMCRYIRPCTNLSAVVMLGVLGILYGKAFFGLVGTYAIAAQITLVLVLAFASYWLSSGLKEEQRTVLSVGMCTRNIGAAFAPLVSINADPRAIVMVAFAVPVTLVASFGTARWLAKRTATRNLIADRQKANAVAAR